VKEALIAKNMTEKNIEAWIVRKPTKRPCNEAGQAVHAMRYEWWGFLAAGDCPAELPVINLQACLTAFFYCCIKKQSVYVTQADF